MKPYIFYSSLGALTVVFSIVSILNNWWVPLFLLLCTAGVLCFAMQNKTYKKNVSMLNSEISSLHAQIELYKETNATERVHAKKQIIDFYNKVTHTFRIPISIIQGYSDILTSGIVKDESAKKEYLLKISEHVADLNGALNEIMAARRMQANLPTIFRQSFDLLAMLQGIVDDMKLTAAQHEIELRLISSSDTIAYVGDESDLRRALYNIIENSIKYMKRAGAVNIMAIDDQKVIKLTIKDDGIGMNDAEVGEIFKQNVQGTNSSGGSGVGLYLAELAVLAHEGEIYAHSSWGLGMSTYTTLPRKTV